MCNEGGKHPPRFAAHIAFKLAYLRMAEITLEERLISGSGVLRIPPTEAAMRYVSLLLNVIREPSAIDRSKRYNPERQRYATCVFLRSGYVVDERPLDYEKRRFDWIIDPTGQLLVALKCANKQIQGKLGGATSNIASFSNLKLLWDEVRIVCYLDTAIQVRLRMDILDDCGDDYSEKEPPPPPAPLPKVPKGTSIADISQPYPDDDDVTTKDPLDEYYNPPTSLPGTWRFVFRGNTAGSTTYDESAPGFSDDDPGVLAEPNASCLDGNAYHLVARARDNERYDPTSFRMSTCGSGELIILSQNFSPD